MGHILTHSGWVTQCVTNFNLFLFLSSKNCRVLLILEYFQHFLGCRVIKSDFLRHIRAGTRKVKGQYDSAINQAPSPPTLTVIVHL
jgi:hypothetical protein